MSRVKMAMFPLTLLTSRHALDPSTIPTRIRGFLFVQLVQYLGTKLIRIVNTTFLEQNESDVNAGKVNIWCVYVWNASVHLYLRLPRDTDGNLSGATSVAFFWCCAEAPKDLRSSTVSLSILHPKFLSKVVTLMTIQYQLPYPDIKCILLPKLTWLASKKDPWQAFQG